MSRRSRPFYSKKYAAADKSFWRTVKKLDRATTSVLKSGYRSYKKALRQAERQNKGTGDRRKQISAGTQNPSFRYYGTSCSQNRPKVELSRLQWIICIIAGGIGITPVFGSGVFDGSGGAFFALAVFFLVPFSVVYTICWGYTASFVRNGIEPRKKKSSPTVETPEKAVEPEPQQEEPDNVTVEVYDAHVTNPEWMGDYVEINDKLTAQMLSPQLIKQLNDSVKILNTTTNPEVFFQRYDFCIGRLSILRECEPYVSYKSGESPTIAYHRFKHQDHFDKATVSLIHRVERKYTAKIESLKTKKAKLNWAGKFYDEFIPYLGIMGVQAQTEAGEISAKLYDLADADPLEA